MALPHLPLVQWGERYPIGAVKVGHQHLQNVLNLQEATREKQGGEREKWLREARESGRKKTRGQWNAREERKGSKGSIPRPGSVFQVATCCLAKGRNQAKQIDGKVP